VIIGSVILGTNFILIVSSNNILIYAAAVLFAVGNGLMWPSVMSILANRAGIVYQGTVQGVANSFGSLASIIGLMIGGLFYNLLGATSFLISAGVIFTVFIMSFRLINKWAYKRSAGIHVITSIKKLWKMFSTPQQLRRKILKVVYCSVSDPVLRNK
jgi:MFS family permease